MSFVRGFSGELTAQTTKDLPHVWFTVLGERQADRLDAIHQSLTPDEICPVVPIPAREPRRGDEIVYEHRALLFDTLQVEPRNILLACEYNPFEAYKQSSRRWTATGERSTRSAGARRSSPRFPPRSFSWRCCLPATTTCLATFRASG